VSQLVAGSERAKSVTAVLASKGYLDQLRAATPRDVDPARVARIVLTCVRQSEKLAACTVDSLLGAGMICAQTGLEPGPIGHAAIVPYKGKAQWQAMFKGLLHLTYRSNKVSAAQAGVVYEADEFDFEEGSAASVHWKRSLAEDRGARVAAFASINPHQGPPLVRVAGWHEIERIRKQYSKDPRSDAAWVTETDEMACKTMLKRTLKLAPISVEAGLAISYDDQSDLGKEQVVTGGEVVDQRPQSDYCNKPLGASGLVCGDQPGHEGECTP